jgi:hypothetical protein
VHSPRFARVVYVLFGAVLVADSAVDLRSSWSMLAAATAAVGLVVVVGGLVDLVRPDATVFGVDVGVGDQPTWVVLLLLFGVVVIGVGTALRL